MAKAIRLALHTTGSPARVANACRGAGWHLTTLACKYASVVIVGSPSMAPAKIATELWALPA